MITLYILYLDAQFYFKRILKLCIDKRFTPQKVKFTFLYYGEKKEDFENGSRTAISPGFKALRQLLSLWPRVLGKPHPLH